MTTYIFAYVILTYFVLFNYTVFFYNQFIDPKA